LRIGLLMTGRVRAMFFNIHAARRTGRHYDKSRDLLSELPLWFQPRCF
jgi:hypothetical protein